MDKVMPEVRVIADILWQFHNDRLQDPSINEMKPYIEPIQALINKEKAQAVEEELNNLLPEFVHILPNGVEAYVSSIEAESAIKKRLAQLAKDKEGR